MSFPIQNSDLASQNLQGTAIVLDLARDKMLHELNEVGTFIWSLCDGKTSRSQIEEALIEEFDVSPEEAHLDLGLFLEELESKKLIQWKS